MPVQTTEILEAMARGGGREFALRMVEVYGGTQFRFPRGTRSMRSLSRVLAIDLQRVEEAARTLGGKKLPIPTNHVDIARVRDREIVALRGSGAKVADLARRFRLTERQVYNVLRQAKP